jgi:hypothetical protein
VDSEHDTEKAMKTNGKRTRTVGGKKYPDYDKQDLAVLANARRWLNGHGLKRFDLDDEERARRAEIYRQQLEANGAHRVPASSVRARTATANYAVHLRRRPGATPGRLRRLAGHGPPGRLRKVGRGRFELVK